MNVPAPSTVTKAPAFSEAETVLNSIVSSTGLEPSLASCNLRRRLEVRKGGLPPALFKWDQTTMKIRGQEGWLAPALFKWDQTTMKIRGQEGWLAPALGA